MFLEFLGFLLYLIDGDADDVDHIAKNGSAYDLYKGDNDCFIVVAGGEIAVAHGDHGRVSPIVRINIEHVPGLTLEPGFGDPGLTP